MASLERRYGGRYRLVFCCQGKRFAHSLGKVSDREARSCKDRLEENLRFVERGLLEIPPDADPGVFLISGGKLNTRPVLEKPLTLGEFFARYQATRVVGAKEENTRYTEDIHIAHMLRILGADTSVRGVTTGMMQTYVDARSLEKGRGGRPVSHVTVKKELGTFAAIWNRWGLPLGLASGPAPVKNLTYRKRRAKHPFQTWEQIERQVQRGGLSEADKKDLWSNLFLALPQVQELLEHARTHAHRPYAYVMFTIAAFTGARRSEILRSRVDDFDFAADTVTIREKKKDRSKELTFRTVPLTPSLKAVMQGWLAEHPGGQHTVCTTSGRPVTVQMAAKAFRRAVDGSKWEVLLGWHVLRHSFASNCALRGTDSRLIDRWMGHQTEEMRLRYQHLFPDQQQQAIRAVFG
jgi:integrase